MKKLLTLAGAIMLSCAAFAQSVPYGDDAQFPPTDNAYLTVAPWYKCNLTYYFQNYTTDVTSSEARTAVQNAFATWAAVTDLTFTEVTTPGTADIVILWGTLTHGTCPFPFDGLGNVLAHAYYPGVSSLNGDVHFDDAEFWSTSGTGSRDLQTVALHEIGHAIGMQHSTVTSAVMYEYYSGVRRNLSTDDIAGIQSIYPNGITGPTNICSGSNVYSYPHCASSSYTWTVSPGINILSGQGTNSISVSANSSTTTGTICVTTPGNCSSCKTVGVGSQTPSNITFQRIGTSCEYKAVCTAIFGATSYQWSTNGFATYHTTTTNEDWATYTPPATITISVRAVTNCGTSGIKTVTRSITAPPGCMARLGDPNAYNPEEVSDISVYPNPSDGIISLDVPALTVGKNVSVMDLTGRIIYTGTISNEHSSIDISAFESGAYILRIEGESEVFTQRIVVQH